MKLIKEKFWYYFTGVYVLSIILSIGLCWDKFKSMTPNEWGDFLTGVFSPLAFLWFILGYRQQAKEIKANTDELKRQAKAAEGLMTIEQSKIEPMFEFDYKIHGGKTFVNGKIVSSVPYRWVINIINKGGKAKNIEVLNKLGLLIFEFPYIEKYGFKTIHIEQEMSNTVIGLKYVDGKGQSYHKKYIIGSSVDTFKEITEDNPEN